MKTITKSINIYRFDELSEKSKEKAREEFYENYSFILCDMYHDDIKDELDYLFPNSILDVQFNLSCEQGSGLNIYGDLDLLDIYDKVSTKFDSKERLYISKVLADYPQSVEMKYNNRYCYCISNSNDYTSGLISDLEWNEEEIDYHVLEDFQILIAEYFLKLCYVYYNSCYSNFYSDTTIEDFDIDFLENGEIYNG